MRKKCNWIKLSGIGLFLASSALMLVQNAVSNKQMEIAVKEQVDEALAERKGEES